MIPTECFVLQSLRLSPFLIPFGNKYWSYTLKVGIQQWGHRQHLGFHKDVQALYQMEKLSTWWFRKNRWWLWEGRATPGHPRWRFLVGQNWEAAACRKGSLQTRQNFGGLWNNHNFVINSYYCIDSVRGNGFLNFLKISPFITELIHIKSSKSITTKW